MALLGKSYLGWFLPIPIDSAVVQNVLGLSFVTAFLILWIIIFRKRLFTRTAALL
jgi:hypothetical protein